MLVCTLGPGIAYDNVDLNYPSAVTLVPNHTPRLREHCRCRLGLGTTATTRGAALAATADGSSI